MSSQSPLGIALCISSVLGLLVGCSSTPTVSSDDAERQITDVLEGETGQRPDEVRCPEDLEAEIGAAMRCELSDGDATYGVTIAITDVTDGVATFDIEVDPEPV
jgi:hypothetical protein